MVTFDLPVLVNVTTIGLDDPTVTFPNFTLGELGVSTPAAASAGALPPPFGEPPVSGMPVSPQPAAPSNPAKATTAASARMWSEIALPSRLRFLRRLDLSETGIRLLQPRDCQIEGLSKTTGRRYTPGTGVEPVRKYGLLRAPRTSGSSVSRGTF